MRQLAFLVVVTCVAPQCNGASLADFMKCIGPQGQGSVCQLDAGTYELNIPLGIGRSNITVKGTFTKSLADTTLRRSPGSTRALMAAYDQTPNLTSITVREFTFDGGGGEMSGIEPDLHLISVKSLLITNCAFVNSPSVALILAGSPANGYTSGAVINNIVLAGC